MPVTLRYAAATLPPMVLIALGATMGGGFPVAALVWLTLLAAGLDQWLPQPETMAKGASTWTDRLCVILALGHLALLPLVVTALAGAGLDPAAKLALFLATASFFGQVSHPNAHELIHRPSRALRALGAAVYASVGFGHHVSAHRLVHHLHVGTPRDPNTPRPGESFWSYLPRAWAGSFRAGLACEADRLARRGKSARHPDNPYVLWLGAAALAFFAALVLVGPIGAIALLGLGALTGAQILMSDYIQHYGLTRRQHPDGRFEPIGAHHSWNAPRGFSSFLMLNAPAHSEHHMRPGTPYDRLDQTAQVPTLPYAMPIMATLATIPPVWHRIMDRRARKVASSLPDMPDIPPVHPGHGAQS